MGVTLSKKTSQPGDSDILCNSPMLIDGCVLNVAMPLNVERNRKKIIKR